MKKREELEAEIERKGANNFHIIEVLLDIRDLLETLTKKQNAK